MWKVYCDEDEARKQFCRMGEMYTGLSAGSLQKVERFEQMTVNVS
ncbi:MAG: hypothetical protein ACLUGQ_08480 [Coprococcus sp.]